MITVRVGRFDRGRRRDRGPRETDLGLRRIAAVIDPVRGRILIEAALLLIHRLRCIIYEGHTGGRCDLHVRSRLSFAGSESVFAQQFTNANFDTANSFVPLVRHFREQPGNRFQAALAAV